MKTIYVSLILLLTCGVVYSQSISQFVYGNSGANISGTSNSLSFTLGEPVIGLISNGESLGQGFWLGAAESIVLSNEDFTAFENLIAVYPNPVREQINLSFKEISGEKIQVQLTDIAGKVILQKMFDANGINENIPVSHIASGIYLLNILITEKQQSKTFKLIKL